VDEASPASGHQPQHTPDRRTRTHTHARSMRGHLLARSLAHTAGWAPLGSHACACAGQADTHKTLATCARPPQLLQQENGSWCTLNQHCGAHTPSRMDALSTGQPQTRGRLPRSHMQAGAAGACAGACCCCWLCMLLGVITGGTPVGLSVLMNLATRPGSLCGGADGLPAPPSPTRG
jgi:hypothetical protein